MSRRLLIYLCRQAALSLACDGIAKKLGRIRISM